MNLQRIVLSLFVMCFLSSPLSMAEGEGNSQPIKKSVYVSHKPSVVRVDGRKLIVQKRLADGSLTAASAYIIKGVCWSPASIGTANDRYARQKEYLEWHETDFQLMHAMGGNTVYVFLDFGFEEQALKILDRMYELGIMVILTADWDGTNDLAHIEKVVSFYKNHPAVLMWAIGNEWNINLYHHKFKTLQEAAEATEEAAKLIKKLDPRHPVAAIFGEIIIPHTTPPTAEIISKLCPSVDVWGLNIYRGDTFGTLFDEWRAITSKPMFLSEFGTDSFRSEKWWPVVGQEDMEMHGRFVQSLWRDIKPELSATSESGVCLGGTVFEWTDEWWKVQGKDGGTPGRQDLSGFPTPWNPYSQPDGFANEEYFGIVRINRSKKPLYDLLREEFQQLR